jgi:hypothetical protein
VLDKLYAFWVWLPYSAPVLSKFVFVTLYKVSKLQT